MEGLCGWSGRMLAYEATRCCVTTLMYSCAVQQKTARVMTGGNPTRTAGPPGPRTGSGAAEAFDTRIRSADAIQAA